MQNLYNELVSPIVETNDKGEQTLRPPTSLMLRAARTIKQLADTNDGNMVIIQNYQVSAQNALDAYTLLKEWSQAQAKELEELINKQKEANESLRDGGGEASPVGNSRTHSGGGDSSSEGGVQSDDSGLGYN